MEDNKSYLPSGDFSEELSPMMCELRKKGDGFAVPEGYFEEQADIISAIIELPENSGMTVPEGYFEELPEQIISGIQLDQAISKNSFNTPEGYFESLPDNVNTHIVLDNVKSSSGFEVPENYFESFTAKITGTALKDTLREGSDADVPEHYFDTLPDRILNQIEQQEKTELKGKIISISFSFKRIAAVAATVTLLIVASVWIFRTMTQPVKETPPVARNTPQKQVAPVITDSLHRSPDATSIDQEKVAVLDKNEKKKAAAKSHTVIKPSADENVKTTESDVIAITEFIDEQTIAAAYSEMLNEREHADNNQDILNELLQDENTLDDLIEDIHK
ncbi:MAG: hypothetical protein Fur0041_12800 [Bacteroidia bacterium]